MRRDTSAHVVRAAVLALVPMALALVGLGSLGAHHGDESNYIEVALHMMETGNYLVPVFHGHLVLDRAPLLYWLIALSFRTFGMSLVAARLPSVLACGLTVALVYWYGVRVYDSTRTATYAALATASGVVACWMTRLAVPDMIMTLGVFLSLAGYVGATTSGNRAWNLFLASVGIGIAGMVKGHVGIVVAVLPLATLVTIVDRRSPGALRLRDLVMPWAWAPALVLCGWWYLYLLTSVHLAVEFAPEHLDPTQTLGGALLQFLHAELSHQVAGGAAGLKSNLNEYPIGFLLWFFPWSLCVLLGWVAGARVLTDEWRERRRETAVLLNLMVTVSLLFMLAILELRSARYLLPIGPAVAILAARFFVRREERRGRTARVPGPVVTGLVLLVLFHGAFGVAVPWTVAPPLQGACEKLRPLLRASDTVVTADLGDNWTTFASVLLGRRVGQVQQQSDAHATAAQLNQVLQSVRTGSSLYVLTKPAIAAQLPDDGLQIRTLGQEAGAWIAAQKGLYEHLVILQVEPIAGTAPRVAGARLDSGGGDPP